MTEAEKAIVRGYLRFMLDEVEAEGGVKAWADKHGLVLPAGWSADDDGVIAQAACWQPIETAPRDRYILLCDALTPRWDGNMEVGKWFGDDHPFACFWSAGGLNGGLELGRTFTHWRELPDDPQVDDGVIVAQTKD